MAKIDTPWKSWLWQALRYADTHFDLRDVPLCESSEWADVPHAEDVNRLAGMEARIAELEAEKKSLLESLSDAKRAWEHATGQTWFESPPIDAARSQEGEAGNG